MKERDIISLYTVSPLHAGSGAIIGAVDLPIQRERHTGWPHVQASALKGAFRSMCGTAWTGPTARPTRNC
jgi:CRISPR-associated protein Cmr4